MSGVLESIVIWFAERALEYLLGKASKATLEFADQLKRDQERGVINEANAKAFEEADTKEKRINAAVRLLSGSK